MGCITTSWIAGWTWCWTSWRKASRRGLSSLAKRGGSRTPRPGDIIEQMERGTDVTAAPATVEGLTAEYLSVIAQKLLGDASAEVGDFAVRADPFEFPKFGENQFYEIALRYKASHGEARASVILRA